MEGKLGIIRTDSKVTYVKAYEEKTDGKTEPITDSVPAEMELKIQGKCAANNCVRTQLTFAQSTPSFEKQNDAQGREVQIPQIAKNECSTVVLAPDRQPFIIGGLKSTGDPQHKIMLMITPAVTPARDSAEAATERTVELDEALPPSPAPVTGETEDKAQIVFEMKYFALPANSKLIKDAGKDGTFVRTDKAFAEQLLELSKKSKDAKVLAAPRVTVIAGEEAMFTISGDMHYTSGYTEQPDGEPKPIIKTVQRGAYAKVKGDLVGDNAILVHLMFVQTEPTLTTHKVTKGREIQIPIVRTTECAMAVTVGNNGVVIIGGLGELQSREDQTLIVQMVPHIIRKGDMEPLAGPLPIADSSEEVSFTVAPQVITFVRVDTEGILAFSDSRNGPAKAVEELIAILKGQALPSFDLLDSKMAVAGRLDELRKLVNGQSVEIDSVLADDKQALVTTKGLKDDRGREGRLVFYLTRKDGKWTIDDLDFKDAEGLEDEIKNFNELMRWHSEPAPQVKGPSGAETRRRRGSTETDTVILPPEDIQAPQSDNIMRIYRLQYADCKQLAGTLANLFTADGEGAAKIISDARSNSLIIQSDRAGHEKIESLLSELDRAENKPAAERNKPADADELQSLQNQRKQIADKIKGLRHDVFQLQKDIGAADLKTRYDVGLQRVVALMSELSTLESRRISLEARVESLKSSEESSIDPTERLRMRYDYVNSDATAKALADKLAQVEMELILARQNYSEDSPEVKKQVGLIEALKKRLDETKEELGKKSDEFAATQAAETHKQQLDAAMSELDQIRSQEDHRRKELAEQDARLVQFGQKQLEIQMIRNEIDAMQQEHDEVSRRITDLRTQLEKRSGPTLYDISEPAQK